MTGQNAIVLHIVCGLYSYDMCTVLLSIFELSFELQGVPEYMTQFQNFI